MTPPPTQSCKSPFLETPTADGLSLPPAVNWFPFSVLCLDVMTDHFRNYPHLGCVRPAGESQPPLFGFPRNPAQLRSLLAESHGQKMPSPTPPSAQPNHRLWEQRGIYSETLLYSPSLFEVDYFHIHLEK